MGLYCTNVYCHRWDTAIHDSFFFQFECAPRREPREAHHALERRVSVAEIIQSDYEQSDYEQSDYKQSDYKTAKPITKTTGYFDF